MFNVNHFQVNDQPYADFPVFNLMRLEEFPRRQVTQYKKL